MKRKNRLPDAAALQLLKLLRGGEKSGCELAVLLEENGESPFRQREGILCPTLHALEQQGLILSRKTDQAVPGVPNGALRRKYALTRRGSKWLDKAADRGPEPPTPPHESGEAPETEKKARKAAPVFEPDPGYDPRLDPDAPEYEPELDPRINGFREAGPEPKEAPAKPRSDDFMEWLGRALRPLRFPPDRRRAAAELSIHYQDRVDLNRKNGMCGAEAAKAALAAMGSPEETGRMLRELHSPRQGWALRIGRILLVLLLIAVWKADVGLSDLGIRTPSRSDSGSEISRQVLARREGSCTDEADFGPWHVSCKELRFQRIRLSFFGEDGSYNSMETVEQLVLLRFTGAPWHRLEEKVLADAVHVLDENGDELRKLHGTDSFVRCSVSCVLPWEYEVELVINVPDSAGKFTICLRQQEAEERLQAELGEWHMLPEEFPILSREEEIRAAAEMPVERFPWFCIAPDALRVRQAVPAEAVRLGGVELSVPWARQCLYREDPVKVQAYNAEIRKNWGNDQDLLHDAAEAELVECVLEFRGEIFDYPLFYRDSLADRLTISGPDGENVDWAHSVRPIWYGDCCLMRLQWEAVSGAERYTLQYTDGNGESRTLEIRLGEEETTP